MEEVNIALVSFIWSRMFNFWFFSFTSLLSFFEIERNERRKKEKYLSPNRIFFSHGIPKAPAQIRIMFPASKLKNESLGVKRDGARRRFLKPQKIFLDISRISLLGSGKNARSLLLPIFTFLFLLLLTYTHHSISLCLLYGCTPTMGQKERTKQNRNT